MLFRPPELDAQEQRVLDEVVQTWETLRYLVAQPRRWDGLLRRVSFARAIQGSNSIEGYHVSLDDALAAADADEPAAAGGATWAAVTGYRDALTYVLQVADDPYVRPNVEFVRALHYTMLRHDLEQRPGRWRAAPIFVVDERTGQRAYEGPDVDVVHELMEELCVQLCAPDPAVPLTVRAAMAHLNLVMVHPFRDGNGRMARALQTFLLARDGVVASIFSSVEEYLGRHQQDYYDVLAVTGAGRWQPDRDTRPWIRFMLTAHLRQGRTLLRRTKLLAELSEVVEHVLEQRGGPSRAVPAVCEAARGARLRRTTYVTLAEVEEHTATRDLKVLTEVGLIEAVGEKRGRSYIAAPVLRALYDDIDGRLQDPATVDPFGG